MLGLPYLITGSALLIVMIVIGIRRRSHIAFYACIGALVAGLISHIFSVDTLAVANGAIGVFDGIVIDGYAYFFNVLFLLAALFTVLIGRSYLEKYAKNHEEFYLLVLTSTLGAMVMAAADHFAYFILGLEILSISLYPLISYVEQKRPPLEGAIKYLILSGVASTLILFGMGLIYMATGHMDFHSTFQMETDAGFEYFVLGQIFLWVGIGFKLSLVPFHMWTPDVYQGAPSVVTGYIATVSKGAVVALLLRYALHTEFLRTDVLSMIITIIALLSMLTGNLLALLQRHVKRLLAYSSIAHLGYLMIAVLLVKVTAPAIAFETVMIYLVAYFVITLAAFGVDSVVGLSEGTDDSTISNYEGLFWRSPVLATVFTLAALSLAGIPLTLGFIAKFYLFKASIEGSFYALLVGLIVGSAIGIFYYLRIIFAMTKRADTAHESSGVVPKLPLITTSALGVLILVFGVYPTPLIDLVQLAISYSGL